MLARAVQGGRVAAARAFLELLHDAQPEDTESVERLEQSHDRDEAELRSRAREGDPRTQGRARFRFALSFMVAAWGVTILSLVQGGIGMLSPAALAAIAGLTSLCIVATAWALRERLRQSVFNRLLARVFIVAAMGVTVHRVLSWWRGSPPELIMATDLIIIATLLPTLAPVLRSSLGLTAATLVGAAIATRWPSSTTVVLAITFGILPVIVTIEWWQFTRKHPHDEGT